MRIDLSCPIENHGTFVKTNSETNEPYLLLKLFNLSQQVITSVNFRVLAYGANGEELGVSAVTLDALEAQPKSYFAETKAISLIDMESAKHFLVEIDHVDFADGTVYEPSEEYTVDVDDSEASIDDALMLRQFVPNATCFATEHENYYRCACGRANFTNAKNCVRCGHPKEDMMQKFSSREALLDTITAAKEASEKQREENEARIQAEIKQKKAKTKKALFISVAAILAACIVATLGIFTYRAILNFKASKAFEKGDYMSAYTYYKKAGSKKIADLTNYVQGASPENLLFQIGLVADDEENMYYIVLDNVSNQFQLVKENKTTKEKTTLTDAALGALNVTKDWIYFVDAENYYIKRISKDGQTIENVLDVSVSHLSVIGNTIYYLKTDYDNPSGLSEEQCQTLAAQGQMETYTHLYEMDIDSKKTKQISDENMSACYIYGGRIYYLTQSDDQWQASNLYAMSLDGKDKQVIVDVPVASFIIRGDDLYYVKMYKDAAKGNDISSASDLEYTIVQMKLSSGQTRTLAEEYMVTYMNANQNKLFFIALDRKAYLESASGFSETQPSRVLYSMDFETNEITQMLVGDMQLFSVLNDDLILYLPAHGMCRIKEDASNFEPLINSVAVEENADSDSVTDTPEE